MGRNERIHYYVEGDCEKVFLDAFKVSPNPYFKPGKVDVFNFVNRRFTSALLMTLSRNTTIVLVYDIDFENSKMLDNNITMLKDCGFKKIIHVQSINSFEDEIVRTTSITHINEVFNTENEEQFKSSFIKHKNIKSKLLNLNIDLAAFWSTPNNKVPFAKYSKQSDLLYIRKR